jgi:hypothetical protein
MATKRVAAADAPDLMPVRARRSSCAAMQTVADRMVALADMQARTNELIDGEIRGNSAVTNVDQLVESLGTIRLAYTGMTSVVREIVTETGADGEDAFIACPEIGRMADLIQRILDTISRIQASVRRFSQRSEAMVASGTAAVSLVGRLKKACKQSWDAMMGGIGRLAARLKDATMAGLRRINAAIDAHATHGIVRHVAKFGKIAGAVGAIGVAGYASWMLLSWALAAAGTLLASGFWQSLCHAMVGVPAGGAAAAGIATYVLPQVLMAVFAAGSFTRTGVAAWLASWRVPAVLATWILGVFEDTAREINAGGSNDGNGSDARPGDRPALQITGARAARAASAARAGVMTRAQRAAAGVEVEEAPQLPTKPRRTANTRVNGLLVHPSAVKPFLWSKPGDFPVAPRASACSAPSSAKAAAAAAGPTPPSLQGKGSTAHSVAAKGTALAAKGAWAGGKWMTTASINITTRVVTALISNQQRVAAKSTGKATANTVGLLLAINALQMMFTTLSGFSAFSGYACTVGSVLPAFSLTSTAVAAATPVLITLVGFFAHRVAGAGGASKQEAAAVLDLSKLSVAAMQTRAEVLLRNINSNAYTADSVLAVADGSAEDDPLADVLANVERLEAMEADFNRTLDEILDTKSCAA